MKIKKYIFSIVLAMSLTTGLVFANENSDAVKIEQTDNENIEALKVKQENNENSEALKVKQEDNENSEKLTEKQTDNENSEKLTEKQKDNENSEKLTEKQKENENSEKFTMQHNVLGVYFDGIDSTKNAAQNYINCSSEKPFQSVTETKAEHSLILNICLNEIFEKYGINPAILNLRDEDSCGRGFCASDKRWCQGVIDIWIDCGNNVFANSERSKKEREEFEKFKKAIKETDISKISITQDKFDNAKERVISGMKKVQEDILQVIARDKKILELLDKGKKDEAISFLADCLEKRFKDDENYKGGKERKNFEENARFYINDPASIKQNIKDSEECYNNLKEKIKVVEGLKFEDVKKLEGKIHMQKEFLTKKHSLILTKK